MIGGWASFGGPHGGYHGTRIAELLPVEIGAQDKILSIASTLLSNPDCLPIAHPG